MTVKAGLVVFANRLVLTAVTVIGFFATVRVWLTEVADV